MMVEIKGVGKRLRGVDVLSDVSMSLSTGSVVGISGVNGSGKTMLMRIVAGLVRPTSGSVLVDGTELWRDIEFPPSLGMLIERPAFVDSRSGRNNLALLALLKQDVKPDDIDELLHLVGLDPRDQRPVRKYSLGMRQRLGIALAIMGNPNLIILDEPTNALDASGVGMVSEIVAAQRARGATILMSCHDAAILRGLADEIYHLAEGHVDGHETLIEARPTEGAKQ